MRRALAGWVLAGAVAIFVACGGSGSSDDGSRTISSYSVQVAVTPCPAGYEHAVVCCKGQDCRTHDGAPFTPCDGTSYPDATRCCSLSDPTSCTTCDPDAQRCPSASPYGAAFTGGCEHCPPGYTGDGPSKGGCCESSNGGGGCFGSASGGCAGTGCGPAPPPCAPTCAAGFTLTGPQVDVCCRSGPNGSDCYVWLPSDPNSFSCGVAGTGCGCRESTGGHAYQMDCDDVAKHCTCAIDGTQRAAFGLDAGACEGGTGAAWAQCQFPR
jgi:hypothetical protein